MNETDNSTAPIEPVIEMQPASTPVVNPATITLLEGMKVLFDEKAGLAPVQVVEKQERLSSNGHASD